MTFPPPIRLTESVKTFTSAPLIVTNKRPEGAVESASHLTVSFSQPMVPVTSHDELARVEPPVLITPKVEGEWQWLDSQTAKFVPTNKRFPMATNYSVTVPAGTKSLNEQKLESSVSWTFTTPAPKLVQQYPRSQWQKLRPSTVVMMRFDQRVPPSAVLAVTKVTARDRTIPIVEASLKDVQNDPAFNESEDLVKLLESSGTVVFFKAAGSFPENSSFKVQVGPGIPSTEGSQITATPSNFSFQTYGPLTFELPRKSLEAGSAIQLRFSNALDPTSFKPSMVQITPSLPVTTQFNGSYLSLSGPTKADTIYKVNVSDSLRDEFGQYLTGTRNQRFKVVAASRWYSAPRQSSVPLGHPVHLNVSSRRVSSVIARVFSVEPDMFRQFLDDVSVIPAAAKVLATEDVSLKGNDDVVRVAQYDPPLAQASGIFRAFGVRF